MKTPYFVTNRNEYENVLKPLLLEWGYEERLNKSCDYNIIVLNDCKLLGVVCNYTDIMQISLHDRYIEPNIYHFLEKAAKLMGKEYKPFLGDRDVIWCSTEKLANQVLKIADKLGYSWSSGKSFKEYSNWDSYREKTCYFIHRGKFADRSFYQEHDYNIISAEEFIKFYKKYLNMEEKRNIAISLEEAKKWYESVPVSFHDKLPHRHSSLLLSSASSSCNACEFDLAGYSITLFAFTGNSLLCLIIIIGIKNLGGNRHGGLASGSSPFNDHSHSQIR